MLTDNDVDVRVEYLGKLEMAAATNLQPIETAPQDGTWLLLWDGEEISLAQWGWSEYPSAKEKTWVTRSEGPGYNTEIDATHWLPLPDPPKVK